MGLSSDCLDLLSRIFVGDPAQRIDLKGIQRHPWYLKNLPPECQVWLGRLMWLSGVLGKAAHPPWWVTIPRIGGHMLNHILPTCDNSLWGS